MNPLEFFIDESSPLVGAAIHDGHGLRNNLGSLTALSDEQRRREEDPFTGRWARLAPSYIVGRLSRFEVDLNRPRDGAVYRTPAEAWGLEVWKSPLDESLVAESKAIYDDFKSSVHAILSHLLRIHGQVVVLDIHSYNHRREGPQAPPAAAESNPEVNVGTGTMDRETWRPLVDSLISDLRSFDFNGRHLDVRENIKFQGGYFGKWIHETFPKDVCVPAIEFKKFFMDEWTGQPYHDQLQLIDAALQSTFPAILASVQQYTTVP